MDLMDREQVKTEGGNIEYMRGVLVPSFIGHDIEGSFRGNGEECLPSLLLGTLLRAPSE